MPAKTSKNILIADDSVFFRTKLGDMMAQAGYNVRFARDGKEVIGAIKANPEIDLLILDFLMPMMDGFGVLKWLGANGYSDRFPVLAITGIYKPDFIIENLKEFKTKEFIQKGLPDEKILSVINALLIKKTGSDKIISK